MPRPLPDALAHILENIRSIEDYTTGKSEQSLVTDSMLADAVERCIERISEASRSIPDAIKANYPHEPWRDIATIGNVLRHNYDRVDRCILWAVIITDLPSLKVVITKIAASLPSP